jgi:hypothetical protein
LRAADLGFDETAQRCQLLLCRMTSGET